MTAARLDQMIQQAAEYICDPRHALDRLPLVLAQTWPEAAALELTVALAAAADQVQSMWTGNGPCSQRAQIVWQQAALVAAEVHYLTVLDAPHARAADLLAHWTAERGMT